MLSALRCPLRRRRSGLQPIENPLVYRLHHVGVEASLLRPPAILVLTPAGQRHEHGPSLLLLLTVISSKRRP